MILSLNPFTVHRLKRAYDHATHTSPSKVDEATFATSNSTTYIHRFLRFHRGANNQQGSSSPAMPMGLRMTICELKQPSNGRNQGNQIPCANGKKEILPLVPFWWFYYVLRCGLGHCNYRYEWQKLMMTLRHVERGTVLYMGILHGQPAHSIDNHNVKMSARNQRWTPSFD
jgi:hypothetical protein